MSQEKDLLKKKHKKIALWTGIGTIFAGAVVAGIVGGIYTTQSYSGSPNKEQKNTSSSDNSSSTRNSSPSDNKNSSKNTSSSKSDNKTPSEQIPINDISFNMVNPTANAYIGQAANNTFSVTTSDDLTGYTVTYQWYENDSAIAGATSSSYLANSTNSDTNGKSINYNVIIHIVNNTNNDSINILKTFTLTPYTSPTVTFSQTNATVTTIVNQEATSAFGVTAPSNLEGSVPTYSWYKNSINSSDLVTNANKDSYAPTGADTEGMTAYYCVISLKNETLQLTYQITKVFNLQTITPEIGLYNVGGFMADNGLTEASPIDLSYTYLPLSEIRTNPYGNTAPTNTNYFIYLQNITNGVYLGNAHYSNTDFTYYSVGWDSAQLTFSFTAPNGTKIFDFSVSMQEMLNAGVGGAGQFYLCTCSTSNVSSTYNWITSTLPNSYASYNLTQNGNYTLSATVKVNGITASYQTTVQVTNAVSQTLPSGLTYSTNISNLSSFEYGNYQEIITYTDGKIDYDKLTNIDVTVNTNGASLESYNQVVYYWYMSPTDLSASYTSPSYTAGLNLTDYKSSYNSQVNGYLIKQTNSSTLDLQQLLQSTTGIWHTIATELNGALVISLYAYVVNSAGYTPINMANGSVSEFVLVGSAGSNSSSSTSSSSSNNVIDTYSKEATWY